MIGKIIGLVVLGLIIWFAYSLIDFWNQWMCCDPILEATVTGTVGSSDGKGFGAGSETYCTGYVNEWNHATKYVIEGIYDQPCPYEAGDVIKVKQWSPSVLVIWNE